MFPRTFFRQTRLGLELATLPAIFFGHRGIYDAGMPLDHIGPSDLEVFSYLVSQVSDISHDITHDGSMVLPYMVTWIPSI